MKQVLAKTLIGISLALSVTAACGGGKKAEPTTPEPEVKTEIVLELGELTLFEGDTAIAKIHADGKSEYFEGGAWKPGPMMKQDGSIEFDGAAVAKVNADGTIVDAKSNSKLPLVVTNDKMTVSGEGSPDFSVEIAETGAISVVGEKQPPKAMRIDGAKTPGQRKTALVFLAMMVGSARASSPPPASGETPVVAPPG
jgi:hypothetical protein